MTLKKYFPSVFDLTGSANTEAINMEARLLCEMEEPTESLGQVMATTYILLQFSS
jgi:hypothetical protein